MDLDRLTLSPYQVSNLYKRTLVLTGGMAAGTRPAGEEVIDRSKSPEEPVKYLGDNERHILVLVRDPTAVFLEEKSFQFLVSVLEACKLSMASVALVNLDRETGRTPAAIADALGSTIVILFGTEMAELGLPMVFPTYQVQPHGGRTYLGADALPAIAADRNLKGRLWSCLKQVFQS